MNYQIICTHNFRMLLTNINDFKIDLGLSYSSRNEKNDIVPDIKDSFVSFYKKKYNDLLYKVGYLGCVNFYTAPKLPDNKIIIFNSNREEFSFEYDKYLAKENIEKYIADLILSI